MSDDFLEKLKKGMNIEKMPETEDSDNLETPEEPAVLKESEETETPEPEEEPKKELTSDPPKFEVVTAQTVSPKRKIKKIKVKKEKKEKKAIKEKERTGPEGQLTVDLYQTDKEVVIQSAVGGVGPEDINVSIENDMVKIKGHREETFEKNERNYFYKECHWGRFSREIVLPVEVDAGKAEAVIKNGVLTIRMPKIERMDKKKIAVKEEE